jgi:hypothetical protein
LELDKHSIPKNEVKMEMFMEINKIGILGAGTMGGSIAQVVAQGGFK